MSCTLHPDWPASRGPCPVCAGETPRARTTTGHGGQAGTASAPPLARCACGVPAGVAHYCSTRDHAWIGTDDAT
jgi:hypothetical protein